MSHKAPLPWHQDVTAGDYPPPEAWRRPYVLPQELGAVGLPGRAMNSSPSRDSYVIGAGRHPSIGDGPGSEGAESAIILFVLSILYKIQDFPGAVGMKNS